MTDKCISKTIKDEYTKISIDLINDVDNLIKKYPHLHDELSELRKKMHDIDDIPVCSHLNPPDNDISDDVIIDDDTDVDNDDDIGGRDRGFLRPDFHPYKKPIY